jgi:YidC/Oxa1 family membrane protein insertase
MDNQRLFLLLALFALSFWTWLEWERHFAEPVPPVVEDVLPEAAEDPEIDEVPRPDVEAEAVPRVDEPAVPALREEILPRGERITVETDRFRAEIDTAGGGIRRLDLTEFKASLDQPDEPVRLLDDAADRLFIVDAGLARSRGPGVPGRRAVFEVERQHYQLNGDELEVRLRWRGEEGLQVDRIYTFRRGSYEIDVRHRVSNQSEEEWAGRSFLNIQRLDPQVRRSMFNPATFSHNGPAYHNTEKYERLNFDDLREGDLGLTVTGGWAAMVEHYFVAAAIPRQDRRVVYFTRQLGGDRFQIGYAGSDLRVEPGQAAEFQEKLYLGPKIQRELRPAAPNLERVVDYGIMWIIAQPLFVVLDWIYRVVGNWGWAIIFLTVLIKLLFYKLSETSGRSLAKMRQLQPRLQSLRERYGDDRQKMNQAMMELYKREKVNPAAGCLPILVQIPVFIGLYWCLLESAELRHAEWMLWIRDLSSPDPWYILPVIMGGAMFLQQKLNPPPPDPMQQKILMMMPLLLIFIGIFMPAGLVLYWAVNTILSVAQQWQINRVVEREGNKSAAKPKQK